MSFGGSTESSYTQKQMNYILNRQRSLPVIQPMHSAPSSQQPVTILYQQQILEYNFNNMVKSKHAAIEIYRPPASRINTNCRPASIGEVTQRPTTSSAMQPPRTAQCMLNVNAKEFTFNQTGSTSGSDQNENTRSLNLGNFNETTNDRMYKLRTSKSSGNLISTFKRSGNESSQNAKSKSNIKSNYQAASPTKSVQFNLQKAKSNECVLPFNQGNRTKFKEITDIKPDKNSNRVKFSNEQYHHHQQQHQQHQQQHGGPIANEMMPGISGTLSAGTLKRSKSLSATDSMRFLNLNNSYLNNPVEFTEYAGFSTELHPVITQAIKDPNELPDRSLMVLARKVLEEAVGNRENAFPAAKLSVIIIQKDKKDTYLDTMLNTCQLWFRERSKRLRNNNVRFSAFLAFLNELYNQLKRSQHQFKLKLDDTTPTSTLLTLLYNCCQDTLQHSDKHSLLEVECLFFVLTSIGRDLESETPDCLRQLYAIIRDVILKSSDDARVKKTLLQLIELRATKWQLPISALNYYYYTKRAF